MNTVGAPHDHEGDVDDALSAVLDDDDNGGACRWAESPPVLDDENDDDDDDDDGAGDVLSAPLEDDGATLAPEEIEDDNDALSALDDDAFPLVLDV